MGGRSDRLAKLALFPLGALLLAACGEQANDNPTSDDAFPNLFGETSNGIGFPHEVVTVEGAQSAGLYLPIFLLAVAIFILIEGLLLYMTWRFRRKDSDAELPKQTHGNNRLEIVWTAIPAAIVTVLFVVSTMVLTEVEATSDDPDVRVDVTAFQFGWRFDYPQHEGVFVAGSGRGPGAPEMVVPVDKTVQFVLKSVPLPGQEPGEVPRGGVIHSFYVPAFFFKRDVIPGRVTEFEVTIEKPGVYGGQCAEFCGLAHGEMFFSVRAVEQVEYEAWIAEQSADGEVVADADAEPDAAEDEASSAESTESTESTEEAA